jgi:uncharacterized protein YkwD
MRRTALLIVTLCSLLGLVTVSGSASAAPTGIDRAAAIRLLTAVNAERIANGLVPLVDDPALRGWAERWSLHMAATGVLAHNDSLFTRSAHQTLRIKVFAENVAWDDAQFGVMGAHQQFRKSPDHHHNMLGSGYRLAGFAVARDSQGRVWVTEDFGTPRTAVAAPAPAPAPAAPAPTKPVARPRTAPAVVVPAVAPARTRVATAPRRAAATKKPAPKPAPVIHYSVVRDAPESSAPAVRAPYLMRAAVTHAPATRPLALLLLPLLVLAAAAVTAHCVRRPGDGFGVRR